MIAGELGLMPTRPNPLGLDDSIVVEVLARPVSPIADLRNTFSNLLVKLPAVLQAFERALGQGTASALRLHVGILEHVGAVIVEVGVLLPGKIAHADASVDSPGVEQTVSDLWNHDERLIG